MWFVFACSLLLCCFMLMFIALLRVLNPLRGSCRVCCWIWVLSWAFLASCMFECWSEHWLCYVSDLALSFVRFQSLFCSLLYLLAFPKFSTSWSWRRCCFLKLKHSKCQTTPILLWTSNCLWFGNGHAGFLQHVFANVDIYLSLNIVQYRLRFGSLP